MCQPPGFKVANKFLVCKLNKPICNFTLSKFHFTTSKYDHYSFILELVPRLMFKFYLDDIIGNNAPFIQTLNQEAEFRNSSQESGDLNFFHGTEVCC